MPEVVGFEERKTIAEELITYRKKMSPSEKGMLSLRKTADAICASDVAMSEIEDDPRDGHDKFSARAVDRVCQINAKTPDSRFLAVKQFLIHDCGVPATVFLQSDYSERYEGLVASANTRSPDVCFKKDFFYLQEKTRKSIGHKALALSLERISEPPAVCLFETSGFSLVHRGGTILKKPIAGYAMKGRDRLLCNISDMVQGLEIRISFPCEIPAPSYAIIAGDGEQDLGDIYVCEESERGVMTTSTYCLSRVTGLEYALGRANKDEI